METETTNSHEKYTNKPSASSFYLVDFKSHLTNFNLNHYSCNRKLETYAGRKYNPIGRMKKWILTIVGGILLIIAVLFLVGFWIEKTDTAIVTKYIRNEGLPTIMPDWQGTPVDQKGRFVNHEFPFLPIPGGILKWTLSRNPQSKEKANDTSRLEIKDPSEFLNGEQDGILWLGHASVYVRLNGKAILLDPVFGKPPLVKEFVHVPSPLEKLKKVDYVLISHDHRDHCDQRTLTEIARKFPNAVFLGGLGMEDIFNSWETGNNPVQTAGWFQQFALPDDSVRIFFLPVRHWSRRGLFDMNQRLWGGYIIQSDKATIYFSGDSGYGSHYKEMAAVFPEIDYFIIGIGQYEPRWFMEPNHNSPSDAIKAFHDARAKTLIPMHYGRFDLSDEPPNEPLRLLKQEAAKANIGDKIRVLTINESMAINPDL